MKYWFASLVAALSVATSCAAQAPKLERLKLQPDSLPELQRHSSQRIILAGYFAYGWEEGDITPAKSTLEKRSTPKVWVEFAKGEDWKLLGFEFHGEAEIEGRLEANPGRHYGHISGSDAKLVDARIIGIPLRLVIVPIVALSVLSCAGMIVKRRIRWRSTRRAA